MRTASDEIMKRWAGLSEEERWLIGTLMGMLKGARRSHIREVARAAAKWESGLGFFIKVRLINEGKRRRNCKTPEKSRSANHTNWRETDRKI